MSQRFGYRPSTGKIVLWTIIAVVLGLLLPYALLFQLMLPMPAIGLAAMLSVVVFVCGGIIPAVVMGVLGLASAVVGLGPVETLIALPASVIPAVIIMRGIRAKKPFFQQLTMALAACLLGAAATMVLLGVYFGGNMIARVIDFIRQIFDANRDIYWEIMKDMVPGAGEQLTVEDFAATYYDTLKLMQTYYEYNLLSNLLGGAAITGVVATLWGNWLAARRGEATNESFKGLSEWFLPSNLTWGLLMTLVLGVVLKMIGMRGGESAWLVVSGLTEIAFIVQAFAALDRKMRRQGSSRGRRAGLMVLMLVAGAVSGPILFGLDAFGVIALFGAASALFGQKGALRPLIDRAKDNSDG